jgi:hypothetical protein
MTLAPGSLDKQSSWAMELKLKVRSLVHSPVVGNGYLLLDILFELIDRIDSLSDDIQEGLHE